MTSGHLDLGRSLVMRFGWNATSYQIVNPGIDRWFSKSEEGVIGYVCRSRVRVVAGAPVCPADCLPAILREWEDQTDASREYTCYFGAAGRLEELLRQSPTHSVVVLGAQPVWRSWMSPHEMPPSLRAQLNRARNKGVAVMEWPPGAAECHPELQRVLQEWLKTRGLPPLHFLVEPDTLAHLRDRRIFVAVRDERVIGFLVASPVPARNGWLTEQFVRGWAAPNGTVELMVDQALSTLFAEGADYVTMGLVPLSEQGASRRDDNPKWLKLLLKWMKAHGRRFYNFGGLEAFKAKLAPHEWEPIYAIYNRPRFSFRALYAIAAAFTRVPPVIALTLGLGRALAQELRWAKRRIRP